MDSQRALELLYDQSRSLEKAVDDIDYEIKNCLPRLEADSSPNRISSFLQDRYGIQRDHMYQLGKVEAQIEDLERRVQGREESERMQSPSSNGERRSPAENQLDWLSKVGTLVHRSDAVPERAENHLDWLDTGRHEPADGVDDCGRDEPDRNQR
ncbi:hypothetical protein AB0V79_27030 [Mesorhizobium ciceri]|uniref:hypothetical protein n=1 Tax=Mesorhizobium ciceri TaxID=39645 RepID=UPI0011AB63A8|nr:hypothetical protein [Mesorhizobium ciceri]